MSKILTVNPGSTSLKLKLFKNTTPIEWVVMTKSSTGDYVWTDKITGKSRNITKSDFKKGIKLFLDGVDFSKSNGKIDIHKIAIRIVHGGDKFDKVAKIDSDALFKLAELNHLAPLHNPPALDRIYELKEILPNIDIFGVFDNGFYKNLPEKAYLYGLPYRFYEKHKIRKYGFHGLAHEWMIRNLLKIDKSPEKVVTCQIGGGVSLSAIQNQKVIDTSMGFTPLDGLLMTTRSGDLDPGIINFLNSELNLDLNEIEKILNKESGLLGVSTASESMEKLIELEAKGHEGAKRAIDLFVYRIQKYIGSYAASMNGLDYIIFSGGVGAGAEVIRERICENMDFLGLEIDNELNDNTLNPKEISKISSDESVVGVFVVEGDEERVMVDKVLGQRSKV